MAISPSSSVQRAREQLAERLRDLRLDARLSARGLASTIGWHESKVSRIESATRAPSEDDIRAWCRACNAERAIPDLIAASRAADSMYIEWRRLQLAGMRTAQESFVPLFERTRMFKSYCAAVVPGFFQTSGYARALLNAIRVFHDTPDDLGEAVEVRMSRNRMVRSGNHRFVALVEEAVLRQQVGSAEVMAGQLSYLLEIADLPVVSLGVIPFTVRDRPVWPLESFTIFDDERVNIELLSAQVNVTAPSELVLYARAFDRLASLAVYKGEAKSLISAAMEASNLLASSGKSIYSFTPVQAASNYAPTGCGLPTREARSSESGEHNAHPYRGRT
jgi:transcriptional regulator with XRE-family HTH domain